MQLAQARNVLVLAALARAGGKVFARHDAVPAADAYLRHGCHPDVVERLWDQLDRALPDDCRGLVHGTPALVHPGGLILAVGMGTSYGLRILASSRQAAAQAGAKTITTWTGGGGLDIRQAYGPDWIFGAWHADEAAWCKAVHAACSSGAAEVVEAVEPDAPAAHDFAAIAAQEQKARRAVLEQRDAAGDLDATFHLFQVLLNAALKEASPADFETAHQLLLKAAVAGHAGAVAMLPAWPALQAQAQRRFAKP